MVTRKSGRAKPEGGVPFTFELVVRNDDHARAAAIHAEPGCVMIEPQQASVKTGRSTRRRETVELR
jgi:hypothetical protein